MSKDLSARYYKKNKGKIPKKLCEEKKQKARILLQRI